MSKEFEYIIASHDPIFEQSLRAGELIRQFVIEKGLIIYGGSAIDFALRLCGDKLYPDNVLTIPDWDFFSSESIKDAYTLADVLFAAGFKSARAIVGQHIETMRVDVADNHFLADITYVPPSIFAKIPTLTYNGVRFVHPDYQRLDVHSSLAFPFSGPPREVIFNRWEKDIKRFNMFAAHYPIEAPADASAVSTQVTVADHKTIFTGFAAYALIYNEFVRESKALGFDVAGVVPARVSITATGVTFDSDGTAESVHMNLTKGTEAVSATARFTTFDPVLNWLPPRAEALINGTRVIIYELHGQLVGVNSAELGDKVVRFTGIQYTMKHFLAKYFIHRDQPRMAATLLLYYASMIKMINVFEDAVKKKLPESEHSKRVCDSVFSPSIRVYGSDNIDLARTVALSRLRHSIYGDELIGIPANYYPGRMKTHPTFDPVSMEFFHEAGEKRE